MPDPIAPVYTVAQQFRAAAAQHEAQAATRLVGAYAQIAERMEGRIQELQDELERRLAEGKRLTREQAIELWRLKKLEPQLIDLVDEFSPYAVGQITTAQEQAVTLARQHSRKLVDAALPPGIDTDLLARAGISWSTLPDNALRSLVGTLQDGSPLATLLDGLGVDVAAGMQEQLITGLGLGYNPRKIGRLMRDKLGMGLTRAVRVSRTEVLRSYRESTRAQYLSNPAIIRAYRWTAAKSSRTCPACLALDGTVYPLEKPLAAHVSCRCSLTPVSLDYADLGLNVRTPRQQWPTGQQWFAEQKPETQRQILGPGAYELYAAKRITLADMVRLHQHPEWGESAQVRPLHELRQIRRSDGFDQAAGG